MKRLLFSLAIFTVLSFAAAGSAWAITLEEAARQAAQQYNARVLSARTVTRDGRRVHEIKLITEDGVVKTVYIPE